ncbi:MAG: potassium channel family protein [Flavobacteriaceae bacterium]|nr:potassium channel family protein [Flavobacteriaceae bacterium]
MLLNIFIGVLVIGITITIQAYGTRYWLNRVSRNKRLQSLAGFDKNTVKLLIFTALFLLTLNFIEAIVWGFTYYLLPGITEFQSLEKAIYFSMVTFTTLGYGEITISSSNRILAGFEAMSGVLLLGWTTAMMFSVIQFIMKNTFQQNNKK